jgi:ribosomal protein S18 acetylase RimI-like enzyme
MSVRLERMPVERVAPWLKAADAEYVESRILAGETREVAEAKAAASTAEHFSGGVLLDTHRLFEVVAEDAVVGFLWIGPTSVSPSDWWVWDIEIHEPYRRKGYARAALELGHAEAKRLGAASIGLNVFGYNTGAKELYESLGYSTTSIQMKREL